MCELNVQSYSQNDLRLEQRAPTYLTIGLLRPRDIPQMDTYPFLMGKDLLECSELLLDFKHLTVWAQVQEPRPLQSHRSPKPDSKVTEFPGTPAAIQEYTASAPSQGSSSPHCTVQLAKDHAIPTQRCVTKCRRPLTQKASSPRIPKTPLTLNCKPRRHCTNTVQDSAKKVPDQHRT
jgi:hypothetical protein